MIPKKSSGHVGSAGVKFQVQPMTTPPIPQPQQQQEQEEQESIFRQPKQKRKKLKFQRE